ncbi:DUF4856 domain-containing protein [Pseudoalteromonas peptidolytica]|uniref:DUF4856 domain-containing protein n=1 Tax=Pseudoalteromonas peptidolytica F12-50-A1 TaxID=1315280 RepID=A0A8I0MU82_9GAMM|nr:DUF4856 domain-containing protein [Pseudoalteromonas peptidolytica]MBE0345984.1 hypothetical protein [Pseudoalteromonas peptidolytica F12-50-A1]NLR14767.1 DUF4856 domain-containing protein [Pseudoalteromonas peptidolytica]GEK10607.1 hypothetical protein PPE03_28560 [Pseudoalteromonas peptidolytica]
MALKKSLLTTAILAATLGLTACGGSSSSNDSNNNDNTNTTPPATNAAPTITVESASVSEDSLGAAVANISFADDSDAINALTLTISDNRFEIVEGVVKLKAANALNFEQVEGGKVSVTITATDSKGAKTEVETEISVQQISEENKTGVNRYAFNNTQGASSVSYSGQIARHAAMVHIKGLMGKLNNETVGNAADQTTAAAAIAQIKSFLMPTDAVVLDETLDFAAAINAQQTTLGQISSSLKKVAGEGGKIAGRDSTYMHKAWEENGNMVGWNDFGTQPKTPEGLVLHYLDLLEAQLTQFENGSTIEAEHNGTKVTLNKLYVTPDGLDLAQLVQKHLNGAVSLSQAADDYLDDLLIGDKSANNAALADGKSYTDLEHKFDEGYGYFGAAIDYLDYTDDEIAGKGGREAYSSGYHDLDKDGKINLLSEYNFGNSTNAAKRDRGTESNTKPTDLTAEAQLAFIEARKLIADNFGTNVAQWSDEDKARLETLRNQALLAWEKSIAATVVHYINDTISDDDGDLDDIASGNFDADKFYTVAKHWSEMKGFALNFQFNPFSPVTDADFAKIHELMGDKPELAADKVEAYKSALLEARSIIANAYGFDAENVANW